MRRVSALRRGGRSEAGIAEAFLLERPLLGPYC